MTCRHLICLAATLVGCQPIAPKPDSDAVRFESEDPLLTGWSVACDQTEGKWTVGIRTDAWVGTARLWMARSESAIEQHDLQVKRSAANASWDCFGASIPMASDLGNPGNDTRFRCNDQSAVYMLLAISDSESVRWTDCRSWGPDSNFPWLEDAVAPTCENPVSDVFADGSPIYETGDIAACD
jgi:hypothetical protein